MSLLDVINNRISELTAATDAKYKAAGYEIPTASQRKAAELSGQNPYEYATQLKQIETQQKEAEKAAKAAQKQAAKASRQSSRSSGSSYSSSGSSSSYGSDSEGGTSDLWGSVLGESEDSETIPSIKSMKQLQDESFKIKQARRRKKGAEKALRDYNEARMEAAAENFKENRPKPKGDKKHSTYGDEEERTTETPSVLAAQQGNLGDDFKRERDEARQEEELREQIPSLPENLFAQGTMEGSLYDIRNAEMADKKAQADVAEKEAAELEEFRTNLANGGLSLSQLAQDAHMTEKQYMEKIKGNQERMDTLYSHQGMTMTDSDLDKFLDTDYQLDTFEQEAAQAYVDQYKKDHENYSKITSDMDDLSSKAFLAPWTDVAAERQKILDKYGITYNEYRNIEDIHTLEQKISNLSAFGEGFGSITRNLYGALTDLTDDAGRWFVENTPDFLQFGEPKTEEEKQAAKLAQGHKDLERNVLMNERDALKSSLQTQSPLAYGSGKAVEQVLLTAASNGILNGSGLVAKVAGMAGGGPLAKALTEIGLDTALVDIPTDTIPEMIENYNNGMPIDQVLANAGINVAINAAINAGIDVGLPAAVKALNGGNAAKAAADTGADMIPGMGSADNLVKTADDLEIDSLIKQQTDAAQTIEDLSKQIPDVSDGLKATDFGIDETPLSVKPDVDSYANQWDDYLKNLDNTKGALDIYNPNLENIPGLTAQNQWDNYLRSLDNELPGSLEVNNPKLDNISLKPYYEGVNGVDSTLRGINNGNEISTGYVGAGSKGILRTDSTEGLLGSGVSANGVSGGSYLPSNRISVSDNVIKYPKVFDDADMQKLSQLNIPYNDYYDIQEPELFSKALETAKANNPHGGAVDSHSSEQIKNIIDNGGKTFLTADGTAGGAVDNGNLTAVFKDSLNNDTPRAASSIAIAGVKSGAVKGDCFGDFLVNSYSRSGFEPVARIKYAYGIDDAMDNQVKEQLAQGIIKSEPDVYALKLKDGYDYQKAIDNYSTAKRWTQKELDELPLFDDYDEMIAYRDSLINEAPKKGAFFDGSGNGPKPPEGPDMRQRGYDKTYQSGRTNIQEGLKSEPEMYEVRHNADTQARADKIFNEAKSLNDAETQARSLISEGDATAVPLTSKLINEYAKTGDTNKAVDLLNALEEKMTKSGQFTQAAKMTIVQNNPDVAMVYLQRQLDKMNAAGKTKFKGKWENFKLTDDELAAFKNIAPGDVDGISALYGEIGARLGKEMPASFMDKVNEYRKLAMLLNPRTHIRNVAANTIMLPVREATDRVSAIGQRVYKMFNSDYEVTQSILPPSIGDRKLAGEIYENSIKPRLEGFSSAKVADNATNMDAFNKAFNENRQIFRDSKLGTLTNDVLKSDTSILNKITGGKLAQAIEDGKITGSALENLRRLDYWLLGEIEDNPYVKGNFESRLGSYIRAQGIKNVSDIPDDVVEIAYQEALKATFKDNNVISEALGGVRNTLNKYSGGVIGDALFPFIQAPSAIAARGIDYSPAGIATSFYKYFKSGKTALDVSNLFDDLSKAVTGTTAMSLGFALANAGVITGPLSENSKEKQFQQSQGQQAYSIKIGDKYYSYDWAQPAGIPLILGAVMYNAMKTDDASLSSVLQTGADMSNAALNAWVDLSPLQTFSELFGSGDYGKAFAEGLKDAASSYVTSFIPSVMGATARATDNNYRTTYDKSNPYASTVNQMIAKVPGLSKTLPASYDMWGNERTRADNGLESVFAQFVNPGQLSHNNTTPIDEEIGRIGAYPNKAEWSVDLDDGSKKLTNEEYADYQREMGQQSYEYANEFVTNNAYYSDLNDENKKEVLSKLYNLAKAQTESDLFGKEIKEGTTNYKLNQIYEAEGTEGVVNYLARNMAINQAGADATDTTIKLYEEGITVGGTTLTGTDAIELYVEARDWCKANGITNNENNRAAYYAEHINDPRPQKSIAPAEQTEASAGMATETPIESVPTTSNTGTGAIPGLLGNPELAEELQTINDYNQMMRDYTGFGKKEESIPSFADTSSISETDKLILKQEQTAIMEQYGLSYSKDNAKLLDKYGETALEAKAILSDADYSFGDNEKKLYKDGGVEAVRNYVETRTSLEDAGLDTSYKIYDSYLHALENYPGMTPTQYANAVKSIDQNDNSEISQKEILAYIQANGLTVEQAEELCRVLGNWTTTPYITKKGTWAMH